MHHKDPDQSLTGILAKLVAFPTESRRTGVSEECFKYVAEYLLRRSMHVKLHNSGGFPSLIATTHETAKPKVVLQAHLDVVPAESALYNLREEDGKLYGRGVYDMKFAAACYLQLVEELKGELGQYDFAIMLTSDEELGGKNGTGYLVEQGFSAGVCVLPDGGNDWHMEAGNNGVWMIELTATGRSAHGSRPWEGENAIEKLTAALLEIRSLFEEAAPHKCSITVSRISGGHAINQVPDDATATIDMRFVNDDHYQAKRAKIENIASKAKLTIKTLAKEPVGNIDLEHPAIKSFAKVASKVRGQELGECRSFGSSDARYFTAQGIPSIVVRPNGGGAHSSEEWIDKADLLEFYEVLKAYIKEAAKA